VDRRSGSLTLSLAAILVLAAILHGAVNLEYDDSASGCRWLTEASSDDLAAAMLPVRVLVVGWVIASGLALTRPYVASGARSRGTVLIASIALAAAQMLFIATDLLSALVWLVALGLIVLVTCGVLALSAATGESRPRSSWLWTCIGWLLVTGVALPVALFILTDDGATRSC
jgi:hypothetical protein